MYLYKDIVAYDLKKGKTVVKLSSMVFFTLWSDKYCRVHEKKKNHIVRGRGFLVTTRLHVSVTGSNPCCSEPCQNKGVCMATGADYECDCTRTGYNGQNCTTRE